MAPPPPGLWPPTRISPGEYSRSRWRTRPCHGSGSSLACTRKCPKRMWTLIKVFHNTALELAYHRSSGSATQENEICMYIHLEP